MNATRDFPEWLSPMVVKELRQGMRSRMFVVSFLLLHAAMILLAFLGLALAANRIDPGPTTGFFWTIIGALLLVVMPLSGLGSVANERQANTLELIFLTRLTTRRILAGKWLAIVAQTALLVCAVLPYAVLRYFLGGVNLTGDLLILLGLMLGSALLSGIAVGLSPHASRLTRILLGIGIIVGVQFLYPLLAFAFASGPVRGAPRMGWSEHFGFTAIGVLLLLLMLEFGASKIAPPAENHSTSRRLIGCAAFVLHMVYALLPRPSAVGSAAFVLLIAICIGALCEPPVLLPSIYRPFVRRGFFGRLAGRLLYPGWQSGVLFTLAMLLGTAALGWRVFPAKSPEWTWWAHINVAGAVLLPAALMRTIIPNARRPLGIYVAIQIALAFLTGFAAILESLNLVDLRLPLAVIPTCGLLLGAGGAIAEYFLEFVLIGSGCITLLSIVLLLIRTRRPWQEITLVEKQAIASNSIANAAESRATA